MDECTCPIKSVTGNCAGCPHLVKDIRGPEPMFRVSEDDYINADAVLDKAIAEIKERIGKG